MIDTTASVEEMARSVIRRQGWGGRLLFFAASLGTATGLFIALFKNDSWQEALLHWSWEHQYAGIIVHVTAGSYAGLTWQEWSAVGAAATALLLAAWLLLRGSIAAKMTAVPGLRQAVRAERQRQREDAFALLGCLLLLLLIPAAIAWGASHQDHGHWDDWDD